MPVTMNGKSSLPPMRSSFLTSDESLNTSLRMAHNQSARDANSSLNRSNLGLNDSQMSTVDAEFRSHLVSLEGQVGDIKGMITRMTVDQSKAAQQQATAVDATPKPEQKTSDSRVMTILQQQLTIKDSQLAAKDEIIKQQAKDIHDLNQRLFDVLNAKQSAQQPTAQPPQPAVDPMFAMQQHIYTMNMLQQMSTPPQAHHQSSMMQQQQIVQQPPSNPMQALTAQFGAEQRKPISIQEVTNKPTPPTSGVVAPVSTPKTPAVPAVSKIPTAPAAAKPAPAAPLADKPSPFAFKPATTSEVPKATPFSFAPAKPVETKAAPFQPKSSTPAPFSFTGLSGGPPSFTSTPTTGTATTKVDSILNKSPIVANDDNPEEYEASVDFKPIVPLPDEVEVVTGEEGETELFCERAKLYRFVEGEFKERGVGPLKLLRDPATMKTRCVMRRDVVHKVCANFVLKKDMTIRPMAQSDKAWIWSCMDFAEDEPVMETFAARFKTTQLADAFKNQFEEACKAAPQGGSPTKPTTAPAPIPEVTEGFGDKFKPAAGSWECSGCLLRVPAGELCKVCNVDKDGKAGPSTEKPTTTPAKSTFSFGLPTTNTNSPAAKPFTPPNTTIVNPVKVDTPKEEEKAAAPSLFAAFKGFGVTSTTSPAAKPSFGSIVPVTEKPTFGTPASTGTASPLVKPAFGAPAPAATSMFGASSMPKATFGSPMGTATPPSSTFGAGAGGFGAVAAPASAEWKGFGAGIQAAKPKPMFASAIPKPGGVSGSPANDDNPEEYEAGADFAPIVPLPDEVEVKTGEEDETELFCERSKLYRFVDGQFKERGLGLLKILQHPTTKKARCVMRREVVHKVCANFALTHDLKLRPMAQSDKAWTWSCIDFSDASDGDVVAETLAARFKTVEMANTFKAVFEKMCAEANTTVPTAATMAPMSTDGFGDAFKPAAGSWDCSGCLLRVDQGKSCQVCLVDQQGNKIASTPQKPTPASSFLFGLPASTSNKSTPEATASSFSFRPSVDTPGKDFTKEEEEEQDTLDMIGELAIVQDDTSLEYDGEIEDDDDDYETYESEEEEN